MNPIHRLQNLRMENDAAGYAMEELRPRFQALAQRHESGNAPRAVSAYQLFQTPATVASQMVALLTLKGGERILEPSAGLGRLLDALPSNRGEVVAVESAAACTGELFRQNREGVRIMQRDFLTLEPQEIGYFNVVVMNPPFHMRADIRHIEHARNFLMPGGCLVAICMNTHHRTTRLKPDAVEWIELPAETFAKEGTHVSTVICKFTA